MKKSLLEINRVLKTGDYILANSNNNGAKKAETTKPKVTIGLCAKDAEKTLRSALNSAVQQSFDHRLMEIILVDDGSKDNTLQIMKEYASTIDIQTRIISGPWRGLGKARNTVVNNALGKYIVWLDSDEILEKDFVRKQFSMMELNPRAGIGVPFVAMPMENVVLRLDWLILNAQNVFRNLNHVSRMPGTGASIYRLSAVREVNGFNEKIEGICEDIDLAYRMKEAGWLIVWGNALFTESHGGEMNWGTIWARGFRIGKATRQFHNVTSHFYPLYRMNPIASLVLSVRYAIISFILTKQRISFLIPFYFTIKMTAWLRGFAKAGVDSSTKPTSNFFRDQDFSRQPTV